MIGPVNATVDQDKIIIVIGQPEAGMTEFVDAAIRKPTFSSEHKHVESDSQALGDQRKRRIILVRAPPFPEKQGTFKNVERVVLQKIQTIQAGNSDITGILHVHSVTNNRPPAFPLSDPSGGFLELHGEDLYRKCVIVTTVGTDLPPSAREHLENGLKAKWKGMMDRGLRVARFDGTHQSAWSAVQLLLGEPAIHFELQIVPPAVTPEARLDSYWTPQNAQAGEVTPQNEAGYPHSSLAIGRLPKQAVVLIVGRSGDGKSKTINRLIGRHLLNVRGRGGGSTTKVIQRVNVPMHDDVTGTPVMIAFDDTPGYADTTYGDRDTNTSLIRQYRERYFPEVEQHIGYRSSPPADRRRIFPNVILLVAAWDSIKADAHNEPKRFTSSVGKSMFNLVVSGLVDIVRTNVIVVVTKSMSSLDQFDDCESKEEKDAQWKVEAGRRRGIILELQRKALPTSKDWRVVFIENGGGSNMRAPYRTLPNGQLSHQNLFEAICDIIAPPDQPTGADVSGMHALRFLAGDEPLDASLEITTETLVSKQLEVSPEDRGFETTPISSPSPASPSNSENIRALADRYLGVTYDPVSGTFGRTCILDLRPKEKDIGKHGRQFEHLEHVKDTQQDSKITADRLHVRFAMREVAGLGSHYSSSTAVKSALSGNSQLYLSRHVTAVAKIVPLCPQLSPEMLAEIRRLPRWSDESMQCYHDFFASYGTHVVLRVALGGVLRVISRAHTDMREHTRRKDLKLDADAPVAGQVAIDAGLSIEHSHGTESGRLAEHQDVMIFCDGGAVVASQLTRVVEQQFANIQNHSPVPPLSGWTDVRMQWINELVKDPAFCPDDSETGYRWLHTLGGLTKDQEEDLRRASESYLGEQQKQGDASLPPAPQRPEVVDDLPRDKNRRGVRKRIRESFTRFTNRFMPKEF